MNKGLTQIGENKYHPKNKILLTQFTKFTKFPNLSIIPVELCHSWIILTNCQPETGLKVGGMERGEPGPDEIPKDSPKR
jgi:hypothetical protein